MPARMVRARKSKRRVRILFARLLLVTAVAWLFVRSGAFRGGGSERTSFGHGLGDADAARLALRGAHRGPDGVPVHSSHHRGSGRIMSREMGRVHVPGGHLGGVDEKLRRDHAWETGANPARFSRDSAFSDDASRSHAAKKFFSEDDETHAPPPPFRDWRSEDPPASLSESLRLDARRGPEMEDVRCVSNTNSLWSVRNEATLRDAMRRVREREPFGWLRFADGDMNQLAKPGGLPEGVVTKRAKRATRTRDAWSMLSNVAVSVGEWLLRALGWAPFADGDANRLEKEKPVTPEVVVARRMTRAMEAWPTLPNLVVSVGEWWLCNSKYREIWKDSVEAIAALRDFAFHAGCFYLPMGTPDDDDLELWAEKGIEGWARAALDANVTIAFVGPRNLAGIPWLTARGWGVEDAATKRARFVDAAGVSDHAERMDAAMARVEAISARNEDEFGNARGDRREPVLFVFSAGHAAKTMITELMRPDRITSKDMFVDAGTALDGFAGVGSRDFNRGKRAAQKYCENVLRRDPARVAFWVDPAKLSAVCQGADVLGALKSAYAYIKPRDSEEKADGVR